MQESCKNAACATCGRHQELLPPDRERTLHRIDNTWLCLDCTIRTAPHLRETVGEEKVLRLIEHWYG